MAATLGTGNFATGDCAGVYNTMDTSEVKEDYQKFYSHLFIELISLFKKID